MNVQELEYNANIRIKFASINEHGGLIGDADVEYERLFSDFAQHWAYKECPELIETRFDWTRRAWVLTYSDNKTQIGAVEHETGIEILVGIVSGIATEAIIGLMKYCWNKWRSSRKSLPRKVEPSLILETVTERTPEGTIRKIERVEVRGPLTENEIGTYIEQALRGK